MTIGPSVGRTVVSLFAIGGALLLAWSVLRLRMGAAVNKVLPPDKRVPLIEIRGRMAEIRRLHEDLFPSSRLPALSRMLGIAGAASCTAAIVVELIRTSR